MQMMNAIAFEMACRMPALVLSMLSAWNDGIPAYYAFAALSYAAHKCGKSTTLDEHISPGGSAFPALLRSVGSCTAAAVDECMEPPQAVCCKEQTLLH
jgi:hypothetical protein